MLKKIVGIRYSIPVVMAFILMVSFMTIGCSKETNITENEIIPFKFRFPAGHFLDENAAEVGGATIHEKKGIIMERPGDGFKEHNQMVGWDPVLKGISLFTGEGSYLRFVGKFSSDYLDFSVVASEEHPLCFRKHNGSWRYLSGKGTVSISGQQYHLGAKRDVAWFMRGFASSEDILREQAVLELPNYPNFQREQRIVNKLNGSLRDTSVFVRRSAAIEVGNLNFRDSIATLEKALREEKNADVSLAIKESLEKLHYSEN